MAALPLKEFNRPLTVDDLDLMPDDGQRYELINGELVVSPSPGGDHQELLGDLYVSIREIVKREKLGKVLFAPYDVQIAPNALVIPDLIFFRNDQAHQYTVRRFFGAPALVLEIVSPTSGKNDLKDKLSLYTRSGVEEYWVIEPGEKRVSLHSTIVGRTASHVYREGIVSSRVVPGFNVELPGVFDTSV